MVVVVVMPTYNEALNIGGMIDVLCLRYFPEIDAAQVRLLVVDDNSEDGTGDIVREKIKRFPTVSLLIGEKRGLGAAYVRGMEYAMSQLNADAVMEMDADFQHDPGYIKEFVSEFIKGADYVIGSRFAQGGSIPSEWEWYRKVISYNGNRFAKAVLRLDHVNDLTTGFRLTRVKGVLDRIDLFHLMGLGWFAYKIDLLYQTIHLSKNTVEVPIHFLKRKEERSKFNLMEMFMTFNVVLILGMKRFTVSFR